MKTTDLRIGNYIGFGDSYVKVYEINENNFYCIDSDDTSLSNKWADLKPIELTEEWLLKMGFEKVNFTFWITGLAVHNNNPEEFYILYEQNRAYIKYVNQLQNLYHALTGEELTIK